VTCRDVEALVTAYLDGELDAARSSALRGHLRVCEACRDRADDHARLRNALAELPPADPPAALWDGVMARLAEAEKVDARRSPLALLGKSVWDRIRPQLWPALAIGCAAAIGVAYLARDRIGGARVDGVATPAITAPAVEVEEAAPPPPSPVPVEPAMDIEASLAVELARIDDLYATSVDDLVDAIAEERAGWAPNRRRAYDAELARLRAAVAATPPVDMASSAMTAGRPDDPFDAADRISRLRDRRERAWQKLVGFLQRAALGETVAMGGSR
jgi:anti-sigma factor RsiW